MSGHEHVRMVTATLSLGTALVLASLPAGAAASAAAAAGGSAGVTNATTAPAPGPVLVSQAAALPSLPIQSPAQREALFKRVMSELDMNGDVLLYINAENLFQSLMRQIADVVALVPAPPDGSPAPKEYVSRLDAFLRRGGFYSVQAFGTSFMPRADGLNTVKSFVARDPAAAGTPFWRMLGGAPRALTTLNYLPADTAVAQVANVDLREAWTCLRAAISEIAGPQALGEMDKGLQQAQAQLGVDFNAFFQALGDEDFMSLQLSETATSTIPLERGQKMIIPQPAIVLGFTLRDAAAVQAMLDTLAAKIRDPQGNPQFVKTANPGALTLYSFSTPLPAPVPLQPTLAVHEKTLLIGSSINAVNNAVAAATQKNGAATTPAFRKLFGDQLAACNGISYVNERFAQALKGIYTDLAKSKGDSNNPDDRMAAQVTERLFGLLGSSQSAAVRINKPDGVAVNGISSQSGQQTVMLLAAMPVMIMAGVALPGFASARATSRRNACINNLRMIDGAKEQWALANNKGEGEGEALTLKDLVGPDKWMPKMPVCPDGGQYQVKPIGANPTCTIPGHKL